MIENLALVIKELLEEKAKDADIMGKLQEKLDKQDNTNTSIVKHIRRITDERTQNAI